MNICSQEDIEAVTALAFQNAELVICDELKTLIPPLAKEEFEQLEKNCIEDGILESIKVWKKDKNYIIIDGHNRHDIAKKNNLEYRVEELQFDNIDAVKIWMIDNQNGRRNLTDGWKYELIQTKKNILLEKGKTNQGSRNDILSNVDKKLPEHNTRNEIAKDLNWSTGKVAMADKVWKQADEQTKEKIKTGDISFNQAYTEIKKEEKKKEREEKIKETTNNNLSAPEGKYQIIYIDPPWKYDKDQEHFGQNVERHYNTMTFDELVNLDVKKYADTDCTLYMWATAPKLDIAIELLKKWGFNYKTCLVWDKVKHNMGFYNSIRHEILLIGGVGSSAPTDKSFANSTDSVYVEERTQHSKKPEFYYDMIEKLHPDKPKRIEFFAREKKEGWQSWGNQL